MADLAACEFFLAINEDGDFYVDDDEGDAATTLQENAGGNLMHMYKVTLHVHKPAAMEVEATLPEPRTGPVRIEVRETEPKAEETE